MSIVSRLFSSQLFRPDPRIALRPLWYRTVEISREAQWYRAGAADTVDGRFDMITAALALVMLRLETAPEAAASAALITELFVEDMDGQLRESGVGDLMVGKQIGKLMSVLGGRLGAYRTAFAEGSDASLAGAIERNMSLNEGAQASALVPLIRQLQADIAAMELPALLEGEIIRR